MDSDVDNVVSFAEFLAFIKKYRPKASTAKIDKEFSFSDFNYDAKWTRAEVC
jgi:hypothetical protein